MAALQDRYFTIYNLSILLITTSTKKISGKILCYYKLQTSNQTSNDCSKRGQCFQSTQPEVLSDYYAKSQRENVLILHLHNTITAKCHQLLYATVMPLGEGGGGYSLIWAI